MLYHNILLKSNSNMFTQHRHTTYVNVKKNIDFVLKTRFRKFIESYHTLHMPLIIICKFTECCLVYTFFNQILLKGHLM